MARSATCSPRYNWHPNTNGAARLRHFLFSDAKESLFMNSETTFGLLVAIGAGIAIGLQGLFTNITGQMAGPLRGGLAIHLAGALVGAGMVLFVTVLRPESQAIAITPRLVIFSLLAGTTGMLILTGIAIAFPLIGQVAGQGTLIFAQMAVAIIVDMFGLAGGEPIPLDGRRILGLLVVAIGTYLLLPPQSNP
jgi:transporter family-2 protein